MTATGAAQRLVEQLVTHANGAAGARRELGLAVADLAERVREAADTLLARVEAMRGIAAQLDRVLAAEVAGPARCRTLRTRCGTCGIWERDAPVMMVRQLLAAPRCLRCEAPAQAVDRGPARGASAPRPVRRARGARSCAVLGCGDAHLAGGFCRRHYYQARYRRAKAQR